MDPLAVVEAQLGSVDSWPPFLLRFMFKLEANSRVMRKVAAFMYGKNVRLSDAVSYDACNCHQSSVELRAWYHVWDMEVNRRHMEQYYSLPLKCLAWINGKAFE